VVVLVGLVLRAMAVEVVALVVLEQHLDFL
jgi:hypothetical protein